MSTWPQTDINLVDVIPLFESVFFFASNKDAVLNQAFRLAILK